MHVKRGQRESLHNQFVNLRHAAQQSCQSWLTFDDHPRAALLDPRDIANELDRVAQTLLGIKQNALSRQRRTIPEWLRELASGHLVLRPAPFIFRQATLKIAQ